jgi:hypothetical protein
MGSSTKLTTLSSYRYEVCWHDHNLKVVDKCRKCLQGIVKDKCEHVDADKMKQALATPNFRVHSGDFESTEPTKHKRTTTEYWIKCKQYKDSIILPESPNHDRIPPILGKGTYTLK